MLQDQLFGNQGLRDSALRTRPWSGVLRAFTSTQEDENSSQCAHRHARLTRATDASLADVIPFSPRPLDAIECCFTHLGLLFSGATSPTIPYVQKDALCTSLSLPSQSEKFIGSAPSPSQAFSASSSTQNAIQSALDIPRSKRFEEKALEAVTAEDADVRSSEVTSPSLSSDKSAVKTPRSYTSTWPSFLATIRAVRTPSYSPHPLASLDGFKVDAASVPQDSAILASCHDRPTLMGCRLHKAKENMLGRLNAKSRIPVLKSLRRSADLAALNTAEADISDDLFFGPPGRARARRTSFARALMQESTYIAPPGMFSERPSDDSPCGSGSATSWFPSKIPSPIKSAVPRIERPSDGSREDEMFASASDTSITTKIAALSSSKRAATRYSLDLDAVAHIGSLVAHLESLIARMAGATEGEFQVGDKEMREWLASLAAQVDEGGPRLWRLEAYLEGLLTRLEQAALSA